MTNIIYKEEGYKIQGAFFEVYHEMGCGYLESVYQECLEKEFRMQGIPFYKHPEIEIKYKNEVLKKKFEPDFICFDKIIVEIKATSKLIPKYEAQVTNYLKSTGMKLGLLVNFGAYPKVDILRRVL
jgi:GxxExxY protein